MTEDPRPPLVAQTEALLASLDDAPPARSVPMTRVCQCGHHEGRHDGQTNACLVRRCRCTHCETTPDLRTQAGRAQARRRSRATPPTPISLAVFEQRATTAPDADPSLPPCRFCEATSDFLVIAYRNPGWPTTPVCQRCLVNFGDQCARYVIRQESSTP